MESHWLFVVAWLVAEAWLAVSDCFEEPAFVPPEFCFGMVEVVLDARNWSVRLRRMDGWCEKCWELLWFKFVVDGAWGFIFNSRTQPVMGYTYSNPSPHIRFAWGALIAHRIKLRDRDSDTSENHSANKRTYLDYRRTIIASQKVHENIDKPFNISRAHEEIRCVCKCPCLISPLTQQDVSPTAIDNSRIECF